ncbi:MAG: hypothetical protein WDN00_17285 [Limisphaerales bacterium]
MKAKSAKVRGFIREAGLDEDGRIVNDDGVDTGRLVAGENDARQHKRDDIFALQQGFPCPGAGGLFGGGNFLHFTEFDFNLLFRAGNEATRARAASLRPLRNSQRVIPKPNMPQ